VRFRFVFGPKSSNCKLLAPLELRAWRENVSQLARIIRKRLCGGEPEGRPEQAKNNRLGLPTSPIRPDKCCAAAAADNFNSGDMTHGRSELKLSGQS